MNGRFTVGENGPEMILPLQRPTVDHREVLRRSILAFNESADIATDAPFDVCAGDAPLKRDLEALRELISELRTIAPSLLNGRDDGDKGEAEVIGCDCRADATHGIVLRLPGSFNGTVTLTVNASRARARARAAS